MLASLAQDHYFSIIIKKSHHKQSGTITSKLDTAGKHCSPNLNQVTNGNATQKPITAMGSLKPRHGVASAA
jgi:hypothetical protein